MLRFLARRLVIAIAILAVLSILVYFMLDLAMDPLDDLRTSTALNRDQQIEARIIQLHLDESVFERYLRWLRSFVAGDLGVAWRTGQSVATLLQGAIVTSIQLVLASTILAIVLGVFVGLISALRQYTTFDYSLTFVSFVLYSLPVFWVAVLLKEFLAIGFNDYLAEPEINWPMVVTLSVVGGLFWAGALGGNWTRKALTFATAALVGGAVLVFVMGSGWLLAPQLGLVGVAVIAIATAFCVTLVFAGPTNKKALYSALTTAGVGVALYVPLQWLWFLYVADNWQMFGLLLLAIAVGLGVGWLYAGPDRGISMRVSAVVAVLVSVTVYADRLMQSWLDFSNNPSIRNRPIATIGAETPGLVGDYWVHSLDKFAHLLLPTVALTLISFAGYTRYQRGSMLEVMGQDYIRTARAKGLPERIVLVRHALRNALMPLASIVPVDIVGLLGGAVITETIFAWNGMGRMFVGAMFASEPDPVMAYVMITGAVAMTGNLIADFLYAVLDPRIRVDG